MLKVGNASKLDILVLLRGIAALMVCFCHFGFPLSDAPVLGFLFRIFNDYGKFGVQIFFVISGFIIPYSLFKGKYQPKNYPVFLLKRFIRLQPPYLAGLAATLIIAYLSYRVRHLPFPETPSSIFYSCFYLHFPADNPVFWTLRVEAEYYIFIGLFFMLLQKNANITFLIAVPALLALKFTPITQYLTLFNYFCYFAIGIAVYLLYTGKLSLALGYSYLAALLVFVIWAEGIPHAIFAAIPVLCILFYSKEIPSVLHFPGTISYSLYLIHFPLGMKMINLLRAKMPVQYYELLFLATMAVVVFAAWVFYRIFEIPSEKYSKQIKYVS